MKQEARDFSHVRFTALGIVDEKVVDKLISDYEAWFGRYEIAGFV